MARVLQVKRGLKANMPTLAQAEFGFTTDSNAEEVYIGNGGQNIGLARKDLTNVDQELLDNIKVGSAEWASWATHMGLTDCSNKDFNTLKTPGYYFGYTGMTNAAFQEISVLEVIPYTDDWLLQRHTRLTDGRMYYRTFISGTTWTSWEVINTSKHPGYSYGTSDLTAGSSELATGQLHFVYE